MITQEFIPPSKRNILRKQKLLELCRNMRTSLPVLDRNQVRRLRIPYYQAILEELHELGYVNSEQFLGQLIKFQENFRKGYAPDSVVCSRPQLMYSHKDIDFLCKSFKVAEDAHFRDNIGQEIDEFIKLGIYYGLGSIDWWWLGDQIFIQALRVSEGYIKDDGKRKAMLKYLYGKFLLENMNDASKAQIYLTDARQLAIGKEWMANAQDTVFVESCKLLYRILIAEGKKVAGSNPLQATRLYSIAEKRAIDVCDCRGQADAMLLQGISKVCSGDASDAVQVFLKVLTKCKQSGLKDRWCEANIHLALAYVKIGKSDEALTQLHKLLVYAEQNILPYYVAQANRFIGEYYLNQGIPHMATPFLIKALQNFHSLNDVLNREQTKNLAAISAGQELLPKYIELILKCDSEKGFANVLKIKKWKDTRELFWSESLSVSSSLSTDSNKSLVNFIDNQSTVDKNSQEYNLNDELKENDESIRPMEY